MARIARVVVPGYPHHVTQRGSRRQPAFFCESDYLLYLNIMAKWCLREGVEIWAYCLMPNHIHLVAVPAACDSLARALGFGHRRYAMQVNQREGWSGHLWQERFASFVMDESYLMAAVRYVELNPVRAGKVDRPEDYRWSSAQAHLEGKDDGLVIVRPMLERISSWREFLSTAGNDQVEALERNSRTGRPLGKSEFVAGLEKMMGRPMRPLKAGRKKINR